VLIWLTKRGDSGGGGRTGAQALHLVVADATGYLRHQGLEGKRRRTVVGRWFDVDHDSCVGQVGREGCTDWCVDDEVFAGE